MARIVAENLNPVFRKSFILRVYDVLARHNLDRGDSDFLAREWLGNALRDDRKYADAAAMYREALRLKPKDGVLLCELAFMKENMVTFLKLSRTIARSYEDRTS